MSLRLKHVWLNLIIKKKFLLFFVFFKKYASGVRYVEILKNKR